MLITHSFTCTYVIITMISLLFFFCGAKRERKFKKSVFFPHFTLFNLKENVIKKFIIRRGGKLLHKLLFYKKYIEMIENENDAFNFFS